MTLRHSVQHAVEGLADRITRVRYEIPPDCTFRAVVTGAADLVSISNIAAQTDGDETFFPLPSGSGSFEIDIMSSGTDTNGLIKLVMGVGGDVEYCFDSQAFETISSILEKKERFTMNGDEERTAFRLHPALNGFTAEWELLSQGGAAPRLVTSTGRMAEVVPMECGAYSLTLRIGDYECARGYIQFLAVEETTTEIRAYILVQRMDFPEAQLM